MEFQKFFSFLVFLIANLYNLFEENNPNNQSSNARENNVKHSTYNQPSNESENTAKHPIILFAGLGGSILYRENFTSGACGENKQIWFSYNMYILLDDCWYNGMKLKYHPQNDTVADFEGRVYIRKIGSTETIEDVSSTPTLPRAGEYYYSMVYSLQSVGFIKNVTIYGIPYDWRKSVVDTSDDYYEKIKNVIKNAVEKNNGTKANLVCHSYGCINMAAALIKSGTNFNSENINTIVSLGAPWGGCIKAMKAFISGENFLLPFISARRMTITQRTLTSLIHLLPSPKVFNNSDKIFTHVSSYTKREFTVLQMENIINASLRDVRPYFKRNNITDYFDGMLEVTSNITKHCVYGTGLKTPYRLNYHEYIDADHLVTDFNYGDETVNEESAKYCENKPNVLTYPKDKLNHLTMLKDVEVFNLIVQLSNGN